MTGRTLPPMPHRDRTINYVEITVPDLAAAKAFYGEAFGWNFADYGPDYASFSAEEAGVDGGLAKGEATGDGPVLLVLYSSDLGATRRKIESAGGRITRPTFDFPGGRRFHFADPAGNGLAVWSE